MSQTFENNTPPPSQPNMPVVFGQALETLVKSQQALGSKSDIPSVITDIILWLDSHQAITTANIFRALGHAPTVQAIKNEFETGTWNGANHKREDMHSIAATLKLYLRTLPDSPFPSKYYSLALRIIREVPDPIQQAYELRVCVYTFPKANRDTLLYLANFLHRVAHRHKDNGVDAHTLAQIVGSYILRPPPTHAPPYSPDALVITTDADAVTAVVQRIIEEAPFFFKTSSKPLAVPKEQSSAHPPPNTSTLKGKALYPYAGGGKWLLALKKEDAPYLLDIKNEEGWLRVELAGEIGYVPLAYVQLVPGPQPPADAPRGGIPLEFDSSALEPVVPAQTPQFERKFGGAFGSAAAFGSMTQLPRMPTSESPLLHTVLSPDYVPSPLLSPKFASPDLSHLPVNPPPPLVAPPSLSTPPLHTGNADLLPPPVDIANIPPPLSSSLPSSVPPGAFGSSPPSISPRGLSVQNSASYPNLPPASGLATATMPSNKAASFIGTSSTSTSSPLSTSAGADGASHVPMHPSLPTKMTRAFSYSAPPPPRLVAPPLPTLGAKTDEPKKEEKDDEKEDKDDEKTDRTDRTDRTDKTSESERHDGEGEGEDGEDDDETSDEDFDGSSASEDVPLPALPPPPAPALPTSLDLNIVTDAEKDAMTAKKRKERAEEVLSTERTYVKQLTVVYDYFVEPLKRKEREKTPILSATEIFAIFSNIEVILNCHRKLLDTLEKRMQTWDSNPEVGDIFLPENTAFIKLYKYYVNNFDKSIITLKGCREKNPEFQKFAQELDYTEKLSGLSIESFLILPVQRIPRYVLLLQDLLKYTHSTHKDFNNLSNALSFIKDLADFINANKSDADNINRILGIQEALLDLPADFTLVVPRRRFIEEGGLLYKKQKAWMYLFSDALLFTKIEKKGKRFKALIHLPTASLNTTDEPGVIKIISTEGTFRFNGETPKDRDHWVKIIRETMDASRVDMLNSAFGDNHTDSGSNKQFMKIKEEENAAKKRNVFDRLINSEQEYVESITYISKTFLAPLRKAVDSPMPMIALSELIDITSNLETLLNCHITFLQSMKERVAEWNDKSYVHDLFSEKAAFLKLYNYYVSNHHKSLEMLDHCIEKYPLFAIFLRDLEAREKAELKVLLTEPLRRVSTYYLIVQEMLQYIKPRTEEHDNMAKVVSRLKEQTEKLNTDLHDHMVTGKKVDKDKKVERAKSSRKFRISNNSK